MKEQEERLIKLTKEWYSIIGSDHHKDRDCHWEIVKRWSYGQPPLYCVQHFGYILEEHISDDFGSYTTALDWLIKFLENAIKRIKKNNEIYE